MVENGGQMKNATRTAICFISLLITTSLVLPAITTAIPSTCYVGVSWKESYPNWGNCYLAQEDADGFLNKITSDSHWHQKFRITGSNNHRGQWEYTSDQNYVETAHFAYYAGHGYYNSVTKVTKMVFYDTIGLPDSPRINPDHCDWGDEGPLKWVALSACDVGYRTYKALDGIHLICAAKCEIDEYTYGVDFGDYLINGYPIKWSWFHTMDNAYDANPINVKGMVNVVGEDSSVGNDHIYWHGSVAADPPVDDYYYEWTHSPSGGWYGQGSGHKWRWT